MIPPAHKAHQTFTCRGPPIEEENEDDDPAPQVPKYRKPPPITIDNVVNSAALLKKLQALTREDFMGRVIGRGLRVYPNTPQAYHAIRNFIDREKLESFTYQLNEEKELKAVIRGMPSDMPPQQIVEALQDLGITLNDCKVMTNRKTGLPMPLFLLSLPRNEANRDIYNITEVCFMKVVVEPLKPRNGPAQCFRCQGFFHSSRYCTRNPKCVKCGKPHLTRDCKKTPDTDATCCHCQGNHPANYSGCPMNPLNKPPPPPKVNAWQEREKKRREELEAKRIQAHAASTTTASNNPIPSQLSLQLDPRRRGRHPNSKRLHPNPHNPAPSRFIASRNPQRTPGPSSSGASHSQ
ncbi:nucleic-acid-binding protein from transposon X-element [Trichonephila clavipes]|nr:nucleic-acid-binding protein from transposon X-element [Trichonephila clavipes]